MGWWALYSEPGRVLLARDALTAAGYATLCPVEYLKRRRKRPGRQAFKLERVVVPVFGRYLFAAGEPGELRRVRGVAEIVRAGAEPLSVPLTVVAALRALTVNVDGVGDVMGERDIAALRSGFRATVGDSIRFTGGAFAGYFGVIESLSRLDTAGEVSAYVTLFGRETLVTAHRDAVEPVRAKRGAGKSVAAGA